MKSELLKNDPLAYHEREEQKPTVQQTFISAVITSVLAILLIVTGMVLKIIYGNSLYFPDQYYWVAVLALVFIAVGVPLGVTAACLINVICRVRSHIAYTEAKKREKESHVADAYVVERPPKA
ncbi:unnamed protein product [Calicophoron daubneyi]|uniref:Uncharacterized protein n=1 Tax=Calicophoron daubneyi TaxID=300641 RepID=A0AAV2T3T8_CALDB